MDWLDRFIEEAYRIMKDNTALYLFCSWKTIDIFKVAVVRKFRLKNILIWDKGNTGMGDLSGQYASKYEFVLYATKGKCKLREKRYSDILKFKRTENDFHPTQKPVSLLYFLIENSSDKNDLVFDPFMGSGSTGVACVLSNRRFIGCEIVRKYYDITKARIIEVIQ